jgi:hypothetical protein
MGSSSMGDLPLLIWRHGRIIQRKTHNAVLARSLKTRCDNVNPDAICTGRLELDVSAMNQ